MAHLSVAEAFWGLGDTAQFALIGKTADDFEVVETKQDIASFEAVMAPLPERALIIKPEGQRTWNWWRLWTTQKLKLDDMVEDHQKRRYRVMNVSDWRNMGEYYEYQITEGPK